MLTEQKDLDCPSNRFQRGLFYEPHLSLMQRRDWQTHPQRFVQNRRWFVN